MDGWLAVLDELLGTPLPVHADVHHVDLRRSEDFEDAGVREACIEQRYAEFEADRDRFAWAVTARYAGWESRLPGGSLFP
ncbi:hypothetical protein [Dactylosporangium sp. NPDC005555]|uniref:hypothetical protein n=1 Tax=Dactylosporangium sp. NPDC005555 TaxID=3154889 RepID=UPI0033AFB008